MNAFTFLRRGTDPYNVKERGLDGFTGTGVEGEASLAAFGDQT